MQNIVLNYINADSLHQAYIELLLRQKSGLKFGVIKKLMVVDGPLSNDVWMVKFLLTETGKLIKVILTLSNADELILIWSFFKMVLEISVAITGSVYRTCIWWQNKSGKFNGKILSKWGKILIPLSGQHFV